MAPPLSVGSCCWASRPRRSAARSRPNRSGPKRLRRKNEFSELFLVLQADMRFANPRERIHAIDYGVNLFAEDELQHLMEFAHGPHEAAQNAPLFAEQIAEVDLRVEPRGRAARDQPSRRRERF